MLSCKDESKKVLQNKFERKWYSIDGNLTINQNKTFEFNRFTSISQSISKGNWKIINDTLILNSYNPKGCYFEEDFIITPPDTTKYYYKETIKNCKPNMGYVNFKNEKFYIKDTLLLYKTSLEINEDGLSKIYNFKKTSYYK